MKIKQIWQKAKRTTLISSKILICVFFLIVFASAEHAADYNLTFSNATMTEITHIKDATASFAIGFYLLGAIAVIIILGLMTHNEFIKLLLLSTAIISTVGIIQISILIAHDANISPDIITMLNVFLYISVLISLTAFCYMIISFILFVFDFLDSIKQEGGVKQFVKSKFKKEDVNVFK